MFIDSEIDFVEFRPDRLAHYAEEGMRVKIIMHRFASPGVRHQQESQIG